MKVFIGGQQIGKLEAFDVHRAGRSNKSWIGKVDGEDVELPNLKAVSAWAKEHRFEIDRAQQETPLMSELATRCREVLEWKKTGVLVDGALRRLAASLTEIPKQYRLTVAEKQTADEAMQVIADRNLKSEVK